MIAGGRIFLGVSLLALSTFPALAQDAAPAQDNDPSSSTPLDPSPTVGHLYLTLGKFPWTNAVVRFDVPVDGAPIQRELVETDGDWGMDPAPQGIVFDPIGRLLFAMDREHGGVSALGVKSDGSLDPVPLSRTIVGDGPDGIALDPSLRVLYVSTDRDGFVHVLTIQDDGSLIERQRVSVPGVRNIDVDGTGRFLYLADISAGVRGYLISPQGDLSELPGSPFRFDSRRTTDVAVARDGRRVYVKDLDRGIATFDVGPAGDLSFAGMSPFAAGEFAGAMVITSDDSFLFLNQRAVIRAYAMDAVNVPSPVGTDVPSFFQYVIALIAPKGTSTLFALRAGFADMTEYAYSDAGQLTRLFASIPVVDRSHRGPTGAVFVPCPNVYYRDADGDGYGDPAKSTTRCDGPVPSGYVTDGTDCDDANPEVHPRAVETCNGLDDDCDGTVDNGGGALCDDGNGCTDDTCGGTAGCAHADNTAPCDDGNACTLGDSCSGGLCMSGSPVVCHALDQCHAAGVCDPATGACSDPIQPNGTVCDDHDLCTIGDACQDGICTPTHSGLDEPNPRTTGYYKRLCHGPHSGEALGDADAACVAQVTATFSGISTVGDICAVIEPSQPNNDPCGRAEDDLMALALNICRARVCTAQRILSACGGNTSVGRSLAESDAILDSPSRDGDTCGHAKCLDQEINSGEALEMNSLTLRLEGSDVRLDWTPPYLNDGADLPSRYLIWRHVLGSDASFTILGEFTSPTFLDATSGDGAFEYEVTAIMN